ncbi:hypothetical protein [Shewanella frigidimarina]|uniref:Uncharacterized protein n=1 Tax=Shewanella frigidimarina TaxID=56812 RepID=A0A119D039_SHEFR|nr:hypothetical protein [Shewanella frigidimarina]KVX02347.1 hypothetical protein AWJ07_14465 [Shewanella frigidimarina]
MQQISFIKTIKKILCNISKWCAYSQMYRLLLALCNGAEWSEQTKVGRNIALLGIFCPFFWFALFSGADSSVLTFHACHSSIVFLIGVVIMIVSLTKKSKTDG